MAIQVSTGLMSGVPIADTVNQLIALAAQPKNLIANDVSRLQGKETALTSLQAALDTVQYISKSLSSTSLFQQQTATSSNPTALAVTTTGNPSIGNYSFTPVRTAQSEQLLSDGVTSSTNPLGAGTVTLRFGSNLAPPVSLDLTNGGDGISRGSISITDRSGATATIDLSNAKTIDDVIQAINGQSQAQVTASIHDNAIQLTDNTGATTSNLKVQEVNSGTTAASLGLAAINSNQSTATGSSILQLYNGISLNALNDGAGVNANTVLPDIQYTLSDGTTGTIDLSPIVSGTSTVKKELTLGDVLNEINAAQPNKLSVQIASDGKSLVATDSTTGSGSFSLTAINGSQALAELGLSGTASGGTINGSRILGGLQTVLLSSLNGGQGIGQLGTLSLTDRSGKQANVVLSSATTVEQVLDDINNAGVGIQAQLNQAGNGIELVDTTGSTSKPMIVASAASDAAQNLDTAKSLNLAVNDNVTSVNSGDLHLQTVSQTTQLSTLNGGAGVAKNTFSIVNSKGARTTINLSSSSLQTVGDVIDQINRSAAGVQASINSTGDGILLQDTAGGSGTLAVTEGGSTTAADLHLLGTATTQTVNGTSTQVINGSNTYSIALSATDTLTDLQTKINALGAGVNAAIVSDGSSRPYRLSLVSQRPGSAGQMVIDTSAIGMTFTQTVQGQDALLAMGSTSSKVLLSSPNGQFADAVNGVTLDVQQASTTPVTVSVTTTTTDLEANVNTLVSNYNKFRNALSTATTYDSTNNASSALTGDSTALRMETDLSNLLSATFGSGAIQSLAQVGVTIGQDGTLTFDSSAFESAYAANPSGVKSFFTDTKTGFAVELTNTINELAIASNSLVNTQVNSLNDTITADQNRMNEMQAILVSEQNRLYTQYYNMDLAIGQMKGDLSIVENLANLFVSSTSSGTTSTASTSSNTGTTNTTVSG